MFRCCSGHRLEVGQAARTEGGRELGVEVVEAAGPVDADEAGGFVAASVAYRQGDPLVGAGQALLAAQVERAALVVEVIAETVPRRARRRSSWAVTGPAPTSVGGSNGSGPSAARAVAGTTTTMSGWTAG